jgi:cell division protein FtsB
LGFEEIKDKRTAESFEDTGSDLKQEVETLKEEIKGLKEQKPEAAEEEK